MDVLRAVILGIIQGVTEFLPISSSGHLAVLQNILGLGSLGCTAVAFDVVLHLGTLLSVLFFFWDDIRKDFLGGEGVNWSLLAAVFVAEVPTAIMGFFLKDKIEASFGSPFCVGLFFIVTGLLLFATRASRSRKDYIPLKDALLVGIFQGLSLFPGISRSGFTIALCLLLGIDRELSGKFSFYIFIPAILGASLLELRSVPPGTLISYPFLAGFLSSFILGLISLWLLMGLIKRGRFHVFSYYLVPLGTLVILFSLLGF